MKNKILVLKNIVHEGPGLIKEVLNEENIQYIIIDLNKIPNLPPIRNFDLLIVMGGPDSANDNTYKIQNELDYIKSAFLYNIPVLGICLGLQIIAKVNSGEVLKNPIPEMGFKVKDNWNKITLTQKGLKDPIFEGIPNCFEVFHLHGETIKLVEKIPLLGKSNYCDNQIIKIGEFNYGFQFHFELTEDMLNQWLEKAPELVGVDKSKILLDFSEIKSVYIERGRKIFKNYLKIIGFLD